MTSEVSFLASTANEMMVAGLRLDALAVFLVDGEPVRVHFVELQAALGLDKRSTTAAIKLLARIGYLNQTRTSPVRYSLTSRASSLLIPRACRPISRADGLTVCGKLITDAGRRAADTDHCWISAVTIYGTILDATIEEHPIVTAEVTFSVTSGEWAGIGMRRLEKTLRYMNESLRISFVLNSA